MDKISSLPEDLGNSERGEGEIVELNNHKNAYIDISRSKAAYVVDYKIEMQGYRKNKDKRNS